MHSVKSATDCAYIIKYLGAEAVGRYRQISITKDDTQLFGDMDYYLHRIPYTIGYAANQHLDPYRGSIADIMKGFLNTMRPPSIATQRIKLELGAKDGGRMSAGYQKRHHPRQASVECPRTTDLCYLQNFFLD